MRSAWRLRAAVVCALLMLTIGSLASRETGAQDQGAGSPTAKAERAPTVEDVAWSLVELDGRPVIEGTGHGEPPLTLLLDPNEKRVGGYGGVNWFSGSYRLDGDRLSLGLLATTMRAGPPELMDQEQKILQALSQARQAVIIDGMLELRAGDQVLARYERR